MCVHRCVCELLLLFFFFSFVVDIVCLFDIRKACVYTNTIQSPFLYTCTLPYMMSLILTTNVHYLVVDIADTMFRGLHVDVIHYKGYPAHYHNTCSGMNKGT